ncbi:hypothetical protein ACS3SW_04155 [Roseobacteraceae bacterium S113]
MFVKLRKPLQMLGVLAKNESETKAADKARQEPSDAPAHRSKTEVKVNVAWIIAIIAFVVLCLTRPDVIMAMMEVAAQVWAEEA